jgi:NitT/TauT family transport system permease protein
MSRLQAVLAILAGGLSLLGLALALLAGDTPTLLLVALAAGTLTLVRFVLPVSLWFDAAAAVLGAVALVATESSLPVPAPAHFWVGLAATWAFAWLFVERLSLAIGRGQLPGRMFAIVIPVVFGFALLLIWEVVTRGAGVPPVLLPPPSAIWTRLVASVPTLWADFQQTFLKAVLAGYVIGCGAGFLVAIAIDRSPFLKRGLLPIGNFVSALPIIGIAPILVMWFGFDWPSKAAVVVCMVFFPMLVNTVAGLNAAGGMERDLMRTYAAGYVPTLLKLRLPAAAPFIFNALKINSTLALIGAIVAEFFGTPIVGMGFRISTEVGKLAIDLVWAEIAVAAVAGSAFYGVIALIERAVTFWHPSVRGGRA